MATTKFYLDCRSVKDGNPAPLKIAITKKGQTALLHLNIFLLPSQWDAKSCKVVNHPNKLFYNTFITRRKADVDTAILRIIEDKSTCKLPAKEIKDRVSKLIGSIEEEQNAANLFLARFVKFADLKKVSTKAIYMHTLRKMKQFDKSLSKRAFEDIDKEWLTDFEAFLSKTSPAKNARNIHLRNIRAVFNDAIDNEITTAYPFRRFKIRPVPTPKRALDIEQLRILFSYPLPEHSRKYVDIFKLIFYLIGINIIDLCNLKATNGRRIEYRRAKTSRLYSVKIEPEAREIINRYKGKDYLLDIHDRYVNHKDYAKRLNENLKRVGPTEIGKQGKKIYHPLFPNLTTYWARHTWATIAASLDIPKETIAAALGHGGNTVTDIYIDFDKKKVDAANRKVIDYVLKKGEFADD